MLTAQSSIRIFSRLRHTFWLQLKLDCFLSRLIALLGCFVWNVMNAMNGGCTGLGCSFCTFTPFFLSLSGIVTLRYCKTWGRAVFESLLAQKARWLGGIE
jgi:hypothetical protein